MKTASAIALFVAVASLSHAGKKPAITEENLAKLQTVKVLFVDGNSESADKLREKLESWTCLKLTNNKSQADAIMNVEERPKPDEGMNWLVTSITITTKTGDQVWSRSKGGGGFVHSGAGMAAENLLHDLAKDACPGWSRRNR
jgi:hypothetical protein